MVWVHKCVEDVDHSIVVIGEKGVAARFLNPGRKQYRRAQVDGCLVGSGEAGKKADWIITKVGIGSLIVELKGSDASRGCDQVVATAQHSACKPWIEARWGMLVICGAVPSHTTQTDLKRQRARLKGWRLEVISDGRALQFENFLPAATRAFNRRQKRT